MRTLFFIPVLAVFAFATTSVASLPTREPVSIQNKARLNHAKELLGKSFSRSGAKKSAGDITEFVNVTTKKFLAKKYRKSAAKISKTILESADKYHFDPVFLMAVILNESSFNPTRRGSMGEVGLMQIRPNAAEWIADVYDIDYKDEKTLLDPVSNIKIGSALLDKLRHQFESKSRLYLSAYNMGAKKVRTLVSDKKSPKEYVMAVMKRYIAMYSAFKVEGDSKTRGEIAFHNTILATSRKVKVAVVTAPAAEVKPVQAEINTVTVEAKPLVDTNLKD